METDDYGASEIMGNTQSSSPNHHTVPENWQDAVGRLDIKDFSIQSKQHCKVIVGLFGA